MNIKEKIAYLQGLAEGLDVGKDSRHGRIMTGIIDVLEDMAHNINEIEDAQIGLEEYVETIDEDLNDLEEDIYEDYADNQQYDEEDISDLIEVECPNCHENVYFESDILEDQDVIEVTCPNCDEVVFVNDSDQVVGYADEEYLPQVGHTHDI